MLEPLPQKFLSPHHHMFRVTTPSLLPLHHHQPIQYPRTTPLPLSPLVQYANGPNPHRPNSPSQPKRSDRPPQASVIKKHTHANTAPTPSDSGPAHSQGSSAGLCARHAEASISVSGRAQR
ncbi:hypothetical protein BU26DRAFT_29374 [Trematosphaeria pertusa]|uniref:Uncharacterized protein n=1 Tax=Trematosphaeria pertusa TaxID=390896 RepID=A0A6A6J247_9PLEO|nr:uncharacterized protein BU26DRAFT_29374 [Trematosphaeria pertusa]KAF2256789.1 hypothetical protein BU26DRAFT_29374 [Trematosphaeria pertusa]